MRETTGRHEREEKEGREEDGIQHEVTVKKEEDDDYELMLPLNQSITISYKALTRSESPSYDHLSKDQPSGNEMKDASPSPWLHTDLEDSGDHSRGCEKTVRDPTHTAPDHTLNPTHSSNGSASAQAPPDSVQATIGRTHSLEVITRNHTHLWRESGDYELMETPEKTQQAHLYENIGSRRARNEYIHALQVLAESLSRSSTDIASKRAEQVGGAKR